MSNAPSTQFYFAGADAIKGFDRFQVSNAAEAHDAKAVSGFSVIGYDRNNGLKYVLADFPAQTNAETFREMCALVAG